MPTGSSACLLPERICEELVAARDAVMGDGAPDAVHRLRTASVHALVMLRLSGRRALRDDLRALRRSAARLRDHDVQARDTDARLDTGDESCRAPLLEDLRRSLGAPQTEALLSALRVLPAPRPRATRRALRRMRRAALAAGARASSAPAAGALHRLRRRIRRLRVAHELLGDARPLLARLQDDLGRWHDLECAARAAGGAERRRLARLAARAARSALTLWRRKAPIVARMSIREEDR